MHKRLRYKYLHFDLYNLEIWVDLYNLEILRDMDLYP